MPKISELPPNEITKRWKDLKNNNLEVFDDIEDPQNLLTSQPNWYTSRWLQQQIKIAAEKPLRPIQGEQPLNDDKRVQRLLALEKLFQTQPPQNTVQENDPKLTLKEQTQLIFLNTLLSCARAEQTPLKTIINKSLKTAAPAFIAKLIKRQLKTETILNSTQLTNYLEKYIESATPADIAIFFDNTLVSHKLEQKTWLIDTCKKYYIEQPQNLIKLPKETIILFQKNRIITFEPLKFLSEISRILSNISEETPLLPNEFEKIQYQLFLCSKLCMNEKHTLFKLDALLKHAIHKNVKPLVDTLTNVLITQNAYSKTKHSHYLTEDILLICSETSDENLKKLQALPEEHQDNLETLRWITLPTKPVIAKQLLKAIDEGADYSTLKTIYQTILTSKKAKDEKNGITHALEPLYLKAELHKVRIFLNLIDNTQDIVWTFNEQATPAALTKLVALIKNKTTEQQRISNSTLLETISTLSIIKNLCACISLVMQCSRYLSIQSLEDPTIKKTLHIERSTLTLQNKKTLFDFTREATNQIEFSLYSQYKEQLKQLNLLFNPYDIKFAQELVTILLNENDAAAHIIIPILFNNTYNRLYLKPNETFLRKVDIQDAVVIPKNLVHLAYEKGQFNLVTILLKNAPEFIDEPAPWVQNEYPKPLLQKAAEDGQLEIVKACLARYPNDEQRLAYLKIGKNFKNSIIYAAILKNQDAIVTHLKTYLIPCQHFNYALCELTETDNTELPNVPHFPMFKLWLENIDKTAEVSKTQAKKLFHDGFLCDRGPYSKAKQHILGLFVNTFGADFKSSTVPTINSGQKTAEHTLLTCAVIIKNLALIESLMLAGVRDDKPIMDLYGNNYNNRIHLHQIICSKLRIKDKQALINALLKPLSAKERNSYLEYTDTLGYNALRLSQLKKGNQAIFALLLDNHKHRDDYFINSNLEQSDKQLTLLSEVETLCNELKSTWDLTKIKTLQIKLKNINLRTNPRLTKIISPLLFELAKHEDQQSQDLTRLLFKNGANINATSTVTVEDQAYQITLLQQAVAENNFPFIQLLSEQGFKDTPQPVQYAVGETSWQYYKSPQNCISIAIRSGNIKLTKALLDHQNSEGSLLLQYFNIAYSLKQRVLSRLIFSKLDQEHQVAVLSDDLANSNDSWFASTLINIHKQPSIAAQLFLKLLNIKTLSKKQMKWITTFIETTGVNSEHNIGYPNPHADIKPSLLEWALMYRHKKVLALLIKKHALDRPSPFNLKRSIEDLKKKPIALRAATVYPRTCLQQSINLNDPELVEILLNTTRDDLKDYLELGDLQSSLIRDPNNNESAPRLETTITNNALQLALQADNSIAPLIAAKHPKPIDFYIQADQPLAACKAAITHLTLSDLAPLIEILTSEQIYQFFTFYLTTAKASLDALTPFMRPLNQDHFYQLFECFLASNTIKKGVKEMQFAAWIGSLNNDNPDHRRYTEVVLHKLFENRYNNHELIIPFRAKLLEWLTGNDDKKQPEECISNNEQESTTLSNNNLAPHLSFTTPDPAKSSIGTLTSDGTMPKFFLEKPLTDPKNDLFQLHRLFSNPERHAKEIKILLTLSAEQADWSTLLLKQNAAGETPLHVAASHFNEHPEIYPILVEKVPFEQQADLQIANKQGYTPAEVKGEAWPCMKGVVRRNPRKIVFSMLLLVLLSLTFSFVVFTAFAITAISAPAWILAYGRFMASQLAVTTFLNWFNFSYGMTVAAASFAVVSSLALLTIPALATFIAYKVKTDSEEQSRSYNEISSEILIEQSNSLTKGQGIECDNTLSRDHSIQAGMAYWSQNDGRKKLTQPIPPATDLQRSTRLDKVIQSTQNNTNNALVETFVTPIETGIQITLE